ncbi:hypothetical protein [Streptomyces sp. NPDC051640]|uniref:hypothetical protein n=1 Tax=Streptomyces sp. NPDC051640 TaxID=3365664 RepID=UPI00378784FF
MRLSTNSMPRTDDCSVETMLPKIDLPDLLFEVNTWTGFLDAFGTSGTARPG